MRPRKRLTAATLAALGAFLAAYSGLPEETLNALLLSLSGIVSAYIAGQSWSDAAERRGAQAAEIEAEQVVPPPAVTPFFTDAKPLFQDDPEPVRIPSVWTHDATSTPPATVTTTATHSPPTDLDLHRILKKGNR